MATWIRRFEVGGGGPRLAVKDCIDVAGVPTTMGCQVVAESAEPAVRDSPVVASARAQGARIVGKTNLNELCWAPHGVNLWTGTPVNPLDPALVPGGSSSGSAVAVATGEVDVGYGTDTGGSVRIPAACCGIAGLKTTFGRIPVEGVHPLATELDVVGPLGADIAAVELGMRLLEPRFVMAPVRDSYRLARLRLGPEIDIDPEFDAAIDRALDDAGKAGGHVYEVDLPGWAESYAAADVVCTAGGYQTNQGLAGDPRLSVGTQRRITRARSITNAQLAGARDQGRRLRAALEELLSRYDALALPTLNAPPPPVTDPASVRLTLLTISVNLSGLPALAMPVRASAGFPASLQLIGRPGGEEELLALGRMLEEVRS